MHVHKGAEKHDEKNTKKYDFALGRESFNIAIKFHTFIIVKKYNKASKILWQKKI